MDARMIVDVLNEIQADQVQVHSRNVQCCCFVSQHRKAHGYGIDRRPSMGISINSLGQSLVHCFSCKYSSTLVQALEFLAEKGDREEEMADVIEKAKSYERLDPDALVRSVQLALPTKQIEVLEDSVLDEYPRGHHPMLLKRGLTNETLKNWDVRVDAKHQRVLIPVRRFDNSLVGAVGRTVVQSEAKYFNYFHFDKSHTLFGEHMARRGRPVAVVEGPIDALMVWQRFAQAGYDADVVALLGSEASQIQVERIVRTWDDVVLFLDNDVAGWDGQQKLARMMHGKVLLRAATYPSNRTDPAQCVQQGDAIEKWIENAAIVFPAR